MRLLRGTNRNGIDNMSTWFARRVLDLISTLNDIYYTRKYGSLARQLGRPALSSDDHRRGFIIIQIDGLAYPHLQEALKAGYAPFIKQMLDKGWLLSPWRCGLPSTTPAVQAGLMFGNRFDIPGFRWYDKEHQRIVSSKRPDQVQNVQARIKKGRVGILRDGSCYVSMFDGDADLALFTLSTLTTQRFFDNIRGIGLLALFLLSPFRVLRLAWMTTRGYLAGIGRRILSALRPGGVNPFDVLSPLVHAVGDSLFSEVQTFGVMLDIYRCAPAIYTNYNGYDEAAHLWGPDSRAAFRALREIDRRIHQINRMRERYRRREYDLYVMSDHGNSPSRSFRRSHGKSLGAYIAAHVGDETSLSVDEWSGSPVHSAQKARFLLEEWEVLERRAPPRLRRILATVRRYVDRRFPTYAEPDYNFALHRDVVVSVSGPLAHAYFNIALRPLDLVETILLYPRLFDALLSNPDIGLLVGRAGRRTVVLGQAGGVLVIEENNHANLRIPPHPLAQWDDIEYGCAQLHRVAHFPHAGDLIIIGAGPDERDGTVVTFEDQVATHGGIGGPQGIPFIIWPAKSALPPSVMNESNGWPPDDAQDWYQIFHRYTDIKDVEQEMRDEG
ncbi:MAG TPA: hypothetical protein ENF52_04390 [Chloroflexi bacterium]|nr:hypothetical protein [Chloroflexota bacterium]